MAVIEDQKRPRPPVIKLQLTRDDYDLAQEVAELECISVGLYAKSTVLKAIRAARAAKAKETA
jgi:hypothetical protein